MSRWYGVLNVIDFQCFLWRALIPHLSQLWEYFSMSANTKLKQPVESVLDSYIEFYFK